MVSVLAASDLGFTRDRHHKTLTSATADVRWCPGMTPMRYEALEPHHEGGLKRTRWCVVLLAELQGTLQPSLLAKAIKAYNLCGRIPIAGHRGRRAGSRGGRLRRRFLLKRRLGWLCRG